MGFFSFLILLCCEGATAAFRAAMVPIHASFGLTTFMLAIAACLTGLTQKTISVLGYVHLSHRFCSIIPSYYYIPTACLHNVGKSLIYYFFFVWSCSVPCRARLHVRDVCSLETSAICYVPLENAWPSTFARFLLRFIHFVLLIISRYHPFLKAL